MKKMMPTHIYDFMVCQSTICVICMLFMYDLLIYVDCGQVSMGKISPFHPVARLQKVTFTPQSFTTSLVY